MRCYVSGQLKMPPDWQELMDVPLERALEPVSRGLNNDRNSWCDIVEQDGIFFARWRYTEQG